MCRGLLVDLQSLAVSGEAGDTHEASLIDLEYSLEVAVDGHQLRGETCVRGDGHTILALHGNHGVTVVLVLSYQAKAKKS